MGYRLLSGLPSSGKKLYIIQKIKEQLASSQNKNNVLVLTNTRRMADDIYREVRKDLGSFSEIWIESISSFCKKIVRENYFLLSIRPGFRVISDFEKRLIVRNLLKRRDIKFSYFKTSRIREGLIREISNIIDILKRNPGWDRNISRLKGQAGDKLNDIKKIIDIYNNSLKKFNFVDFVDLTLMAIRLLEENSDLIDFKYIAVYETEDMDRLAGTIIELLLRNADDALISLDEELCIYQFRGAVPGVIKENLINKFNFKEVHLVSRQENISSCYFIETETREEQAECIAKHIAMELKSGVRPGDIALISRSVGDDLWIYTEALKRRGINYILVGGIGFFRQPEIIRFMALLDFIHRQYDSQENNILRSIEILGIMDSDRINIIRHKALISGQKFLNVLENDEPDKWAELKETLSKLGSSSSEKRIDIFMYDLMMETGLLKTASNDLFTAGLYSYFFEIVNDFREHYSNLLKRPLGFSEFMENLYDLLSGFGKDMDIPYISDQEAVRIMTVQQIKGSVLKNTYIVDMTESNFPRPYFENPILSNEEYFVLGIEPVPGPIQQYESEKRLFTVASTRATDKCIYCWYNSDESGLPVYSSIFLKDIQGKHITGDIKKSIIDSTDLFINIFENLDPVQRRSIADTIPQSKRSEYRLLERVVVFNPENIYDAVKEGMPDVFSYTSLEAFRNCPENFFIKYVLGLKEPQSPYQILGLAVHRILQELYRNGNPGLQKYMKIVKQVWNDLEFYSNFEARNMYVITVRLIENYLRNTDSSGFSVEFTEKDFRFNYQGIPLAGRFDRIDVFDDGSTRVVDYKTGKTVKMGKGLLSDVSKGENFQIPIYRWASGSRYFSIYWLRKDTEKIEARIDFTEEAAAEALSRAEEHIKNTVDKIGAGVFIPNGKNCRNCYYRRICTL